MKTLIRLSIILFSFIPTLSYCSVDELNSILGFKIGISKNEAIIHFQELDIEFDELPDRDEIVFKYDLLRDGEEINLIRLSFVHNVLSKIEVYFYKYNMLLPLQNSHRFQKYLDVLDEIYDNGINWKGKWKNKDGTLLVTTEISVLAGDIAYDVLIIEAIPLKAKNDSKEE